jgi:hypothetical protein
MSVANRIPREFYDAGALPPQAPCGERPRGDIEQFCCFAFGEKCAAVVVHATTVAHAQLNGHGKKS